MSDMEEMASRANRLINAITRSLMGATEAAAERLEQASETAQERSRLQSQVAQVQVRMSAFAAVLECVDAQRRVIQQRQSEATGALKALYTKQLECLAAQEAGILEKVGVAPAVAQAAVQEADQTALYRREGSKFVSVRDDKFTLTNGKNHE